MHQIDITMRQLVSHLSGIRHYEKKPEKSSDEKTKTDKKSDEFQNKEYHIKDYYDNVQKSLILFQDDDLMSKPGKPSVFLVL